MSKETKKKTNTKSKNAGAAAQQKNASATENHESAEPITNQRGQILQQYAR